MATNTPAKAALRVLFDEVVDQISDEEATTLIEGYRERRSMLFGIRENILGRGHKTDFTCCLAKEEDQ